MVEAVKLKHNGENWSEWRESIQKIAERKQLANYLAGTPPEPFKDVFDSLARRMIECTVPKSFSNHFRHYATARECIDYLTKRFNKLRRSEQVKTTAREKIAEKVGEKGEKLRGRDDEAATASGPGTATTDHQKTDGGPWRAAQYHETTKSYSPENRQSSPNHQKASREPCRK